MSRRESSTERPLFRTHEAETPCAECVRAKTFEDRNPFNWLCLASCTRFQVAFKETVRSIDTGVCPYFWPKSATKEAPKVRKGTFKESSTCEGLERCEYQLHDVRDCHQGIRAICLAVLQMVDRQDLVDIIRQQLFNVYVKVAIDHGIDVPDSLKVSDGPFEFLAKVKELPHDTPLSGETATLFAKVDKYLEEREVEMCMKRPLPKRV